jgi:hypothetical protein
MKKYEYRVTITQSPDLIEDLQSQFNNPGEDGWEPMTCFPLVTNGNTKGVVIVWRGPKES